MLWLHRRFRRHLNFDGPLRRRPGELRKPLAGLPGAGL